MAQRRKHQENGRHKHGTSGSSRLKSNYRKERHKMEHANDGNIQKSGNYSKYWYYLLVFSLASLCGILHRNHVAHLFESDRHFSHLSTLERELVFRTEMGLYYSYYKTMIKAPSFGEGLHSIMYDNITEYPTTINTLKRFNLYPEVILGGMYNMYESVMSYLRIRTKECWQTNRGDDMPPIQSCEGLGDESYFYVENVFLLNGINIAVFFLLATYISGSVFGGGLAVIAFFYNHGECTRVQWTPPLRESFAYPFLMLQMLAVTHVLKMYRPSFAYSAVIAVATACFMVPWQFAQFALMTQTVAVFGVYVLQYIGSHKIKVILLGQTMGLFITYVLLFGNEMLFTSFFSACLISVYIVVLMEPLVEKLNVRPCIWIAQGALWLLLTVTVKITMARLLQASDDAHITDIFRSKFTDFKNFHSMLYVCAAEFDFMEVETLFKLTKTLLIPCAVLAVLVVVVKVLYSEYTAWMSSSAAPPPSPPHHHRCSHHNDSTSDSSSNHSDSDNNNGTTSQQLHTTNTTTAPAGGGVTRGGTSLHGGDAITALHEQQHRSKQHAELLFHILQLIAYTMMAVIIMRLKLFWTPHLCLLSSLLASKQLIHWPSFPMARPALLAALVAGMSVQGYANLHQQWAIIGEFSNYPLEQMVYWINTNTPTNGVFAGPMPTMATIKLCTNRPIVNHPHYEDVNLRARTKKVYTMYSRKPEVEVWENMMDLQVDYAILEGSWCSMRPRPGCGMAEIWDLEDSQHAQQVPVCHRLKHKPHPYFTAVFKNDVYEILKVVKSPPQTRIKRHDSNTSHA